MKVLRVVLSSAMFITLFGCSALTGEARIDYGASAKRAPSLEVPPDLTIPSVDDRYKVPEAATNYSDYTKGGAAQSQASAAVLPEIQTVRFERNGAQRFLVVKDKPENVWPIIKAFWQEIGLTVKSEDQTAGVMETDWAENRAKIPQSGIRKMLGKVFNNVYSSGERDQYLTRLERNKDGKSTEIYVSYRGKEEVFNADKTTSKWQDRPVDTEIEAIMLQRLMVRLGATELQANSALQVTPVVAASSIAQPDGSSSLREVAGGKTVILMSDTFDRAWRKVGLAIEGASVTLEDKDREKGIYFLHSAQAQKSLADKLKFWKSAADADKKYRVNVKDSGETCEVSVTDQDGAQNKTSKQILELIYKNIEPK
ncbi:MAG: outer membrane protein assembly factor BamC [Gallionella sp.]|nr:outer membrane protein assembly factor BamC [Gallionella sp.]